jgi:membrane associated rhomboid family serine protease
MCKATLLCSARISPWGVVTSLFIYDSWTNLVSYGVLSAFFVVTHFLLSREERLRREVFFAIVMYAVAIVGNLIGIFLAPTNGTYGPSGALYAFWGLVSGFALFNGLSVDPERKRLRLFSKNIATRAWAAVNLFTTVCFVLYLGLDTSQFLSAGLGVNVFAHGIGFLGGLFSTYVYRFLNRNIPIREIILKSK